VFNLEKLYDNLPWLAAERSRLERSVAEGTFPHSLIIQGRNGMGRRQLALWIAASVLGAPVVRAGRGTDAPEPIHPDFVSLEPELDKKSGKQKKSIGINQIRSLIEFLSLTSHGTGGRVAVLYPADRMTVEAANSLLKTLEEPPGSTVIILITETLGHLPATVISRCQRVRLVPPEPQVALDWLEREVPGQQFSKLLEFAGGAPLEVLALKAAGFSEFANQFMVMVDALEQSGISPVAVAAKCRDREAIALQLLEAQHCGPGRGG
jgi:DNA polymerase-3 subunit delta'